MLLQRTQLDTQTLAHLGIQRRHGFVQQEQLGLKRQRKAKLELALLADVSGLDLVTVQDHPYQSRHLDAWTLLSVIAARDWDGHMAVYPLGENRHEGGVLRTTLAPAAVDEKTQVRARAIAEAILDGLDYVGVLGVELFDLGDDVLLVNEIAPRVHNTGHWTQDGCVCDQFEQHIRAVAGWSLGPTTAHARIEMTNLLGDEVEDWRKLSAKSDERLHLYGKAEARPGRKMAHVNRVLGMV